ncbi:MAG TPA: hypothetical protein VGK96_04095 [Candidatus Sulfotelmatobacter sp.]|jgi:ABC-type dipeptide/oligopeptide/nickel transport system permease subunit
MKRITFLSILFAALIEFAIERARFDLWIMTVAMVTLLWNPVGRALRSHVGSQKHDHNVSASQPRAAKKLSDLERTQDAVTNGR